MSGETFSIIWKVENFHLSNRKMDGYLYTPDFKVGILENTMWQLLLAPAGIDDPLFVGCSIARGASDEERSIIRIAFKICVIAEGGAVRFERRVPSCYFAPDDMNCISHFIRKSSLLSTDKPHNNLTIHCEMKKLSSDSDLKYDYESLSSDLAGLFESGFRSDFTMYCRGEIFKVHKFVLLSRWPAAPARLGFDISARDDIIMTGIEPSDLRAFLTFMYCGKLPRKDISMELCSYMHEQCCDAFLESFETPVSGIEFVTHMHFESKQVTWEVGDRNDCEEGFYRVIPLEEIYPSDMVIKFGFEKRDDEEWLELGMIFTGVIQERPILVDGKISFINKDSVVCYRKIHHLVDSNEDLHLPSFIKKSELFPNVSNSKCVEIDVSLCDGCMDTRLVSTSIKNASSFNEVKDLRSLQSALAKSAYARDLKLKFGGHLYSVHSSLVAARSETLKNLMEENSEMIEIGGSFRQKTADSFVRHLYGACPQNLDEASKSQLLDLAKSFSLSSLEEKIGRM